MPTHPTDYDPSALTQEEFEQLLAAIDTGSPTLTAFDDTAELVVDHKDQADTMVTVTATPDSPVTDEDTLDRLADDVERALESVTGLSATVTTERIDTAPLVDMMDPSGARRYVLWVDYEEPEVEGPRDIGPHTAPRFGYAHNDRPIHPESLMVWSADDGFGDEWRARHLLGDASNPTHGELVDRIEQAEASGNVRAGFIGYLDEDEDGNIERTVATGVEAYTADEVLTDEAASIADGLDPDEVLTEELDHVAYRWRTDDPVADPPGLTESTQG